ncbi:MAG: PTS system mannose/fructose/sorbose family transporter subunit IID [Collinsella sp.]|nr:PTS system mannose/fructose/sorbose family transporter subunit IID [Collinsella sp.]
MQTDTIKKLDDRDLRRMFWRSCMLDSSWNYERQQNMGYSYAIAPVVEKLYEKDSDKQKSAYARSLDFMSITPQLSTLLLGIDAAMEEEDAANPTFDGSTIAAVKTSLMGPLAGIGDSLIAGTLRVIATGIAIGFAQQGSPLGAILLLLVFNIPAFAIRWFGLKMGYEYGSSFITDAAKGGLMEKVTFVAGVVGLMAIGGMVASYITVDLPIMVGSGDFAQPLTDYLTMIMPCLPQLLVFGFMYWIMGRKIKTTWVLVGTIVVCIALCWIGTLL